MRTVADKTETVLKGGGGYYINLSNVILEKIRGKEAAASHAILQFPRCFPYHTLISFGIILIEGTDELLYYEYGRSSKTFFSHFFPL